MQRNSPKRQRTPIESSRNSAGHGSRIDSPAPTSGVGISQEIYIQKTQPAPLYFDPYTVSFVRWV